ncbi:MAG: UpxY family transcription antiterminator [Alistipes sp.]
MPHNENTALWYPIRVTYSRELKLKTYLDDAGIENFLPMHYILGTGIHSGSKRLVPIIHNLIFAHATRKTLDNLKQTNMITSTMRYIMDRNTGLPMIIPEDQMRNFIAIAGTNDEHLIYLPEEETALKAGDSVRITGGPFAGVEGELLRIKGDRRVVVKLAGFFTVATAFIHPSLLEKIDR